MNPTRQILIDGDVAAYQQYLAPKLDYRKAEIAMHVARTMANSLPENLRIWSHHWLQERRLPSMLPNDLLPKALQIKPVIAEAVGISVRASSEIMKPVAIEVRNAMEGVVLDMHANGDMNRIDTMKERMQDARQRILKATVG